LWANASPFASSRDAPAYRPLEAGSAEQGFAHSVPHNIRPTLQVAAQDKPIADFDGCNVETALDEAEPPECVYGTEGPLVALFGDSHALQWLPALMPSVDAGDFRVTVVTADACPPFSPEHLHYRSPCEKWQPEAIRYLNDVSPDLIVASVSLGQPAVQSSQGLASANIALSQLPAVLPDAQVLWIADTPNLKHAPSSCASGNVDHVFRCATPRSEALLATESETLRRTVRLNDWDWLDMNKYLCSEISCGIILGDVLMYRDNDHLSATFSRELAPALAPEVLSRVTG
jgi:hypothetical protein